MSAGREDHAYSQSHTSGGRAAGPEQVASTEGQGCTGILLLTGPNTTLYPQCNTDDSESTTSDLP